MIAKIAIGVFVLTMLFFSLSPLNFGILYLFFRPLIQPFATEGHNLVPGVPLTGSVPLVFITFSTVICLFRRGYSLLLPNVIPLYLLMFLSITSFYNTSDYALSIGHVLKIGSGVAMYCLLYNSINTLYDAKKVLYAIVLMSIIPMLFGYYQFFSLGGARVNSIIGMANAYGEFLGLIFCASLMLLLQANKRSHRIFFLCLIGSTIISMILAKNRGQWIALLSGLVLAYFGYMGKIKIRTFILWAMLIAVIFSSTIIGRFKELNEKQSWGASKNTLQYRISTWKGCISLVLRHPITGHGIGTSTLVLKKHLGFENVPHNDYVRLLLETGIPSLLLYLIFLFSILLDNIRLTLDKKNWFINYPMLALIIFWIILSSAQNMIFNVIVFPLFMALVAISTKWNLFHTSEVSD